MSHYVSNFSVPAAAGPVGHFVYFESGAFTLKKLFRKVSISTNIRMATAGCLALRFSKGKVIFLVFVSLNVRFLCRAALRNDRPIIGEFLWTFIASQTRHQPSVRKCRVIMIMLESSGLQT